MKFIKNHKDEIGAVAAVILVYLFMFSVGITCPIRYVTGISCAGCGMTRAWLSLLRGDIRSAYMYHPLFPLPVLLVPVFLFRHRISKKVLRILTIFICVIFLAVYIKRLCNPNDLIVVFDPETGAFGRLIRWIFHFNFT